jgi:hypothetical protein
MTWCNTLELALQKFDKLTTKYGQILPDKVQTSNFFKFFMFRILLSSFTAFLMIRKRDCDRRVHLRPHKNDRQ